MANKMLKYFFTSVITLTIIAFSCSSQGDEETAVSFEVIHGGTYCSVTEKKDVHVTNKEDFTRLMDEVYMNLDQRPIIPDVDFTKNDVVAVFMGAKNTGGYTINFDKVIKRKDDITCYIFETSPGKNCSTTMNVSYPYELVKIPKLNKKVKFVYKQRTKDC